MSGNVHFTLAKYFFLVPRFVSLFWGCFSFARSPKWSHSDWANDSMIRLRLPMLIKASRIGENEVSGMTVGGSKGKKKSQHSFRVKRFQPELEPQKKRSKQKKCAEKERKRDEARIIGNNRRGKNLFRVGFMIAFASILPNILVIVKCDDWWKMNENEPSSEWGAENLFADCLFNFGFHVTIGDRPNQTKTTRKSTRIRSLDGLFRWKEKLVSSMVLIFTGRLLSTFYYYFAIILWKYCFRSQRFPLRSAFYVLIDIEMIKHDSTADGECDEIIDIENNAVELCR